MKSLLRDALPAVAEGWLRTRIIFFALIPSCYFDLPSDLAHGAAHLPLPTHLAAAGGHPEYLGSFPSGPSSSSDVRAEPGKAWTNGCHWELVLPAVLSF